MILTLEKKKGPVLLQRRKVLNDGSPSPVKTMDPQHAVDSKIALGLYYSFL
jgi:hypothetical protein